MDPHSICLLDPDPDPAADEISSKSKKIHNIYSYLTNLKKNLSYGTYLNFIVQILKKA
jgi:hypothetical protein